MLQEAWIELFHNDQYVVASYGYTSGSYADSGNSVVLHLKKGDRINVKARPGTDVKLYGDSDEYYTTFCGALLSPTVHGSGSGKFLRVFVSLNEFVHEKISSALHILCTQLSTCTQIEALS